MTLGLCLFLLLGGSPNDSSSSPDSWLVGELCSCSDMYTPALAAAPRRVGVRGCTGVSMATTHPNLMGSLENFVELSGKTTTKVEGIQACSLS